MMLPPVLDDHGRPLDQIRIVGLTATGHHGVFEHERRDGQAFTVDVILHLDIRAAAASDDLDDTVDYGSLSVDLADAVRGTPLNLIETLASRLALMCLADPRIAVADVVLHKPQAPIPESFADVMIVVRRSRADLESRDPQQELSWMQEGPPR
ncbi:MULTISPECIES: dihydroneopterin aldolase [unclassified Kineosporia]|uniref:dihydroneopterin aldolase n=1 Tax=unclassified Kineosporia TaxID=2626061 RepID=UPI001E389A6C|nr:MULTISPECIES: dihydroneopterin aldolase [unclassified Kineosporia]